MSTSRNHPFTLTELLVAIAIVLILVGITIAGVGYARRRADEAKAVAILEQFAQGLEAFRAENGYYPPAASATDVKFHLIKKQPSDAEPTRLVLTIGVATYNFYSEKSGKNFCEFSHFDTITTATALEDSWDNPIQYQCPGANNKTGYDLWSKGQNTASADDDITNWGDNKH